MYRKDQHKATRYRYDSQTTPAQTVAGYKREKLPTRLVKKEVKRFN